MVTRTLKGGSLVFNGWHITESGDTVYITKRYGYLDDWIALRMQITIIKLPSYSTPFVKIQERLDYAKRGLTGVLHDNIMTQDIPIILGEKPKASDWKVSESEGEIRLEKEFYDINNNILILRISARLDKIIGDTYELEIEEGIYYIKGTSSNTIRYNRIEDKISLSF